MKSIKRVVIGILFLASLTSLAKEIRFLHKGEAAPFEGYIFDLEQEKANRIELLEKDSLISQVELYKLNASLYEQNSKMWQNTAERNTERLLKLERNSFWQNSLYFGIGVFVTGALAIGLSKGMK